MLFSSGKVRDILRATPFVEIRLMSISFDRRGIYCLPLQMRKFEKIAEKLKYRVTLDTPLHKRYGKQMVLSLIEERKDGKQPNEIRITA